MAMAPRAGLLVLLALLALSSVPSAAAATAAIDAEGALPLRVAGSSAFETTGGALLVERDTGALSWRVAADRLDVVAVEFWTEEAASPAGPLAPASGIRTTPYTLGGAEAFLSARLPGFSALLWSDEAPVVTSTAAPGPAPGADWAAHPDARVFRLSAPFAVSAPTTEGDVFAGTVLGRPVPFQFTVPAGRFQVQTMDTSAALIGPLAAYVTGAELVVRHEAGVLRLLLDETVEERDGSVYVPGEGWTGPGTHEERIRRYVQLATPSGDAAVTTDGVPSAAFGAAFSLDLAGALSLADATGSVRFDDGSAQGVQGVTLAIGGAFKGSVTPSSDPERAHLAGTGDVAYLRAGPVLSSFEVVPVAAAAGAAAFLGLALVAWKLFGPAGVALFSRMAKDDVLDHGLRADLYALVQARPGASPNDLVAVTGAGWSTVMYHLSVLERNELVVALKDGRYRRYFDRTTGRFANGRKNVVAVLKNATTAAMARAVREQPGIVQRRLAERFGLAASSVHWHVQRLEGAGLVVKERAGQGVALRPGPAWDAVDAELAAGLLDHAGPVAPA